jgi:hypothetical protein
VRADEARASGYEIKTAHKTRYPAQIEDINVREAQRDPDSALLKNFDFTRILLRQNFHQLGIEGERHRRNALPRVR